MSKDFKNFEVRNGEIYGDGKRVEFDEYNELLKPLNAQTKNDLGLLLLAEFYELYSQTMGSESGNFETKWRQNQSKKPNADLGLFARIKQETEDFMDQQNWGFREIWRTDGHAIRTNQVQHNQNLLNTVEGIVAKLKVIKDQGEEEEEEEINLKYSERQYFDICQKITTHAKEKNRGEVIYEQCLPCYWRDWKQMIEKEIQEKGLDHVKKEWIKSRDGNVNRKIAEGLTPSEKATWFKIVAWTNQKVGLPLQESPWQDEQELNKWPLDYKLLLFGGGISLLVGILIGMLINRRK